ncbi:MAG: thymidine phosphorylase, partial [Elusimicrobiota bacterium]
MLTYHDVIAVKKAGRSLEHAAIVAFVRAVADKTWTSEQIAAMLMAIRCQGMKEQEIVWLTLAMAESSQKINPPNGMTFAIDKHSTGGVGDGISLVLAPLVASLGLCVPMMSGRSLGLTGGTLDKLEAIPGIRTSLDKKEIDAQLRRVGVAMFGQSQEMAPVDRRLYSMRDVIGAVDSLPLIVASILSKKLVEGLHGIVFDVKCGRGAIFEDEEQARELARALVKIGRLVGLKTKAVLTYMDEPLGRAVGNMIEVAQAWEVLSGTYDEEETHAECLWGPQMY